MPFSLVVTICGLMLPVVSTSKTTTARIFAFRGVIIHLIKSTPARKEPNSSVVVVQPFFSTCNLKKKVTSTLIQIDVITPYF